MKTPWFALAAAAFAAALSAQGDVAKAPPSELEKLTAEWKAASKAYSDALKAVQATEEFKTALKAEDNDKLRALMNGVKRPDAKAFGGKVLACADTLKGDDAIKALAFATTLGDAAATKGAIERIEKDYIGSAGLLPLMENASSLSRAIPPEDAAAFLDRVIAENENKEPRAWAMYWKAFQVQRNKDASDAEKAAAEKLMADAAALVPGTLLADRIAAPVFEKERLQIGMEAPEIVGEDVDGVPFKLSDYRGKVVVIDFWGFW